MRLDNFSLDELQKLVAHYKSLTKVASYVGCAVKDLRLRGVLSPTESLKDLFPTYDELLAVIGWYGSEEALARKYGVSRSFIAEYRERIRPSKVNGVLISVESFYELSPEMVKEEVTRLGSVVAFCVVYEIKTSVFAKRFGESLGRTSNSMSSAGKGRKAEEDFFRVYGDDWKLVDKGLDPNHPEYDFESSVGRIQVKSSGLKRGRWTFSSDIPEESCDVVVLMYYSGKYEKLMGMDEVSIRDFTRFADGRKSFSVHDMVSQSYGIGKAI